MVRHLLLFFLLVTLAGAQTAGDGKVTAQLSHQSIGMGESAVLSISINGASDVYDVPTPAARPDFGLQIQPIGREISMTSINGVSQTSSKFNFLITPLKTGRYVIDGVTVTVNGVDYTTLNQRLEVTDAMSYTRQPQTNPWNNPTFPSVGQPRVSQTPRGEDVMLEAELEPKKVYKHQATVYTLRLLAAVRLFRDPRYNPISPTGFLALPFKEQNSSQTQRNGRNYAVTEARTAFFPLTEGEYTFPASEVELNFGGFFGRSQRLSTHPKVVEVLPLPTQGQPESFTGAVGEEFQIKAHLNRNQAKAGQTVELKVEVEGDGHLGLVPYPYLPDWEGISKRQTDGDTSTEIRSDKVESKRTYVFRLKVKDAGEYQLDGIAFAYFRPSLERYEVVKAPPLQLQVAPGEAPLDEAEAGKALKNGEGESPLDTTGPTQPVSSHLSPPFFITCLLLGLSGLWLSLSGGGGKGLRLPSWGKLGKPKDISQLEKALETLAPGHDSISRTVFLESQNWNLERIERYENLRRKVSAQRYRPSGGSESFEELLSEYAALRKGGSR